MAGSYESFTQCKQQPFIKMPDAMHQVVLDEVRQGYAVGICLLPAILAVSAHRHGTAIQARVFMSFHMFLAG